MYLLHNYFLHSLVSLSDFQVLATLFFVLAALIYKPPTESPEIPTAPAEDDKSDLPLKDLNGVIIVNQISRL